MLAKLEGDAEKRQREGISELSMLLIRYILQNIPVVFRGYSLCPC